MSECECNLPIIKFILKGEARLLWRLRHAVLRNPEALLLSSKQTTCKQHIHDKDVIYWYFSTVVTLKLCARVSTCSFDVKRGDTEAWTGYITVSEKLAGRLRKLANLSTVLPHRHKLTAGPHSLFNMLSRCVRLYKLDCLTAYQCVLTVIFISKSGKSYCSLFLVIAFSC